MYSRAACTREPRKKKGLSGGSSWFHSSAMLRAAPPNNAPVHLPNENTVVDVVDGNARRLAASNQAALRLSGTVIVPGCSDLYLHEVVKQRRCIRVHAPHAWSS